MSAAAEYGGDGVDIHIPGAQADTRFVRTYILYCKSDVHTPDAPRIINIAAGMLTCIPLHFFRKGNTGNTAADKKLDPL